MVFSDYNPVEDFFVHGYAADERVYITDQAMNVIRDFEAYPKGYKNVPPLTVKEVENNDAYRSHWQGYQIFGSIHWDPYRKLIYRIMEEPNVNLENEDKLYFKTFLVE